MSASDGTIAPEVMDKRIHDLLASVGIDGMRKLHKVLEEVPFATLLAEVRSACKRQDHIDSIRYDADP